MKIFLKAGLVLATLCGGAALAEDNDKYWYALGSFVDPDSEFNADDGWGLQLGVGSQINRWVNLEGYLSHTDADGIADVSNFSVGVDMQWVFTRDRKFNPYLFAGIGVTNPDSSLFGDGSASMLSAGAGFVADLFGSERARLRGEYRHRSYDEFSVDFGDNLYSLGIQVSFGSRQPAVVASAEPVETDSDNDGVIDRLDECPGTPQGITVDDVGCEVDSDGDGVANSADQCPNTVSGAAVDERGCELDGDNDGVVDRNDECPDTAEGVQVDIKGCEIKAEIRLPNVNFESNSDRLVAGAETTLDGAAATLRKNPEIKVEVAGHTDSDGAAEYNESLSARRAETVRDYLINAGVGAERITARGYGESQPIADNNTAAGKAANRRVVLRVTER